MTDTRFDRAPGGRPIPTGLEEEASSGLLVYSIGFALAVILTVTSFWVANTALLCGPGIPDWPTLGFDITWTTFDTSSAVCLRSPLSTLPDGIMSRLFATLTTMALTTGVVETTMKRLRRCLGTAQAKKALVVAELDILDVQRDDFAITGRYLGASAPSGAPATFLGGLGRLIRQAASHGVELGHKPTRQRTGQSDARIGLGRPRETVQRFLAWQVSTRSQLI
jgi:hypothetical protein